jgi:membrane protease subunit HflK
MNQALQYKNQQIPAAEADADAIVQKANAYKATRLAEAEGQVARFNEMYKEYSRFPEVTRKRLFFEKMEELMPNVKVIITDGSTQTMLPLDDFASSSDTQAVTVTENASSGNDNTEEEVTEDEE